MTRLRSWLASPGPSWATTGRVVAIFAVPSVLAAIALVVSVSNFYSVRDEREDRIADRDEGRKRDHGLDRRVVRIERTRPELCRRSPTCRGLIERQPAAPTSPGRKPRRDREAAPPDQRADRPPRAPDQPPLTPSPTPGGGGDDTPPAAPPPPLTTPPTPQPPVVAGPVVEVDLPPVDLDGDQGLLPDVNLPPVDVPPLRVPGLR